MSYQAVVAQYHVESSSDNEEDHGSHEKEGLMLAYKYNRHGRHYDKWEDHEPHQSFAMNAFSCSSEEDLGTGLSNFLTIINKHVVFMEIIRRESYADPKLFLRACDVSLFALYTQQALLMLAHWLIITQLFVNIRPFCFGPV